MDANKIKRKQSKSEKKNKDSILKEIEEMRKLWRWTEILATEELSTAIKSMLKIKSPGIDGILDKFYQTFESVTD